MSRIIAWFVHNPVAANLFMVVMCVGGLLALLQIRQEEFPSIETDIIQINVAYLGATPEETESSICVRIEEAIEGAVGIDRVTSRAVEGACVVIVETEADAESASVLSDIENRVMSISTFPDDAERPLVSELQVRGGVLQVAIHGDTSEATLKEVGQRARDEIAALPGLSQVSLRFTRPYEISIEISEYALRRHGLTLDAVAEAIRSSSLDLPGGSVKTRGGEVLFRTIGQSYRQSEFEDVVVLTREDGTALRLSELGRVVDGFADTDLRATFAGEPATVLSVQRVGEEDILEIARTVRSWAERFEQTLPAGVTVTVFNDESLDLVARLSALSRNAASGILLVVVILATFLRFRLALWVAAGVPISLLGALMFFPAFDLSISTLTVMAFILVLGILVDDAIVVGESVHTQEQKTPDQVQAAIDGTRAVYIPVIFGVLTTVAAFLPLVLLPGHMGQFFGTLGYTAILCLVFSLIESQLILPAHLAHRRTQSSGRFSNPVSQGWQRFQRGMASWLERLAKEGYGRLLARAIEYRYTVAAAAIGLVIVCAALFTSGRMRYQFFPSISGDVVFASLTLPNGTPFERTRVAVERIERAAARLGDELEREGHGEIFVNTFSSIGATLFRAGPDASVLRGSNANRAEVAIELVPDAERDVRSKEVANRWRELTGPIPDAVETVFEPLAFTAGEPINFELRGGDVETLTQAAAALRAKLASYAGVFDIADSFRAGKQEVQLALAEDARSLGLTQRDLARQVRQAFYGEEAQRIQRGRDDVKVMVRYPEDERRSLGSLEQMRIRTREGVELPFAAVAEASLARGFASIKRVDRDRVVNVTADVDRAIATPEEIVADIERALPDVLSRFPGITHRLSGEQRERSEASAGLLRGTLLGLLLIYALLAIPLRSYLQPLVIMSVIPFGTVGAVFGHYLMGWDLVFFSVLGIVALSGVVVNGSLVLVHYINGRIAEGVPFLHAVTDAGISRFRPIVLTSLTTYIGLVPLMFEAAVAAQPLIPMAISLGYGVLMASAVTLFLVPCGYVILDDLLRLVRREESAVEAEAAG